MIKLDCLGDMCPVPVIKLQRYLESLEAGEQVMLVSDHSCTRNTVQAFALGHHFACDTVEVMNGVWEITLKKI